MHARQWYIFSCFAGPFAQRIQFTQRISIHNREHGAEQNEQYSTTRSKSRLNVNVRASYLSLCIAFTCPGYVADAHPEYMLATFHRNIQVSAEGTAGRSSYPSGCQTGFLHLPPYTKYTRQNSWIIVVSDGWLQQCMTALKLMTNAPSRELVRQTDALHNDKLNKHRENSTRAIYLHILNHQFINTFNSPRSWPTLCAHVGDWYSTSQRLYIRFHARYETIELNISYRTHVWLPARRFYVASSDRLPHESMVGMWMAVGHELCLPLLTIAGAASYDFALFTVHGITSASTNSDFSNCLKVALEIK